MTEERTRDRQLRQPPAGESPPAAPPGPPVAAAPPGQDGASRAGGDGTPPPPSGETAAEAAAPAALDLDQLRPAEIVRHLDEYIIGQADAKRSVALALRNRIRRQRLDDPMRQEVIPKNILMIGPTGVGKTEIARRLARMTGSPFIKVEATKFTEVGYVGRDVEAIVRDLLEQTITEVHDERTGEVAARARQLAEERILDALVEAEEAGTGGPGQHDAGAQRGATAASAEGATDAAGVPGAASGEDGAAGAPRPSLTPDADAARRRRRLVRRRLRRRLEERQLEDRVVEIEVEEAYTPPIEGFSGTGFEEVGNSLADFFSQLAPPRKRRRRTTVAEARTVLQQEETDNLVDMDRVYDDAIALVEDSGIVFVDEMDKIAGRSSETGPDVSGQGVQRDLLPLLEGSTVHTRYGPVRTDHILFIAAGAFTMARPSDLIPEMQGRFPVRVELRALTEDDLQRILVEPTNALTKQYIALLGTEEVTLEFTEDGLREIAHQAALINEQDENIGARRLFTILEKVLEDVSFRAEEFSRQTLVVDADYVRGRLGDLVRNEDLRRYVL